MIRTRTCLVQHRQTASWTATLICNFLTLQQFTVCLHSLRRDACSQCTHWNQTLVQLMFKPKL